MSSKSSSLLESPEKVEKSQSTVSENLALQDAFSRIQNDNSHFSTGIPEVTAYDDYVYPDCGYDDNGNN